MSEDTMATNDNVRGHLLSLTLLKKTFTRHSPDIPRIFPVQVVGRKSYLSIL